MEINKSEVKETFSKKVVKFEDRVPCNWIIDETESGITAYNTASKETFEGTISEFNERLNG